MVKVHLFIKAVVQRADSGMERREGRFQPPGEGRYLPCQKMGKGTGILPQEHRRVQPQPARLHPE